MRRFPRVDCLVFIAGAAVPIRPPQRLPPRRFRKTKVPQTAKKTGFSLCLQASLPTWDYRSLPHCLLATSQDVADYRNRTAPVVEFNGLDEETLRARAGRLRELLEDALDLLDDYGSLVLNLSELEFPDDLQRRYQRLLVARNVLVQEFHSLPAEEEENA